MFPSLTLIEEACEVSPAEAQLLQSPQAPIVLLRRRKPSVLSQNIAPGNPNLGVMLPSAPLHWLLLTDLGEPVVATSGNRMDEPICINEQEALTRLEGLADFFLVHDRPIVRHADDSIVRIMLGREQVLRRARGYAPLPVPIGADLRPTLAVGALLKNTVALSVGSQAFISQHIGDLEYKPALEAFEGVIQDFVRLYDTKPAQVSADLHPDYLSTQYAQESGLPLVQVQHHYAHVLACMAENEVQPPALGISWDGTGLGTDRTIWGGEFLRITEDSYERVGHLAQFRLPGGDQAAREPRRAALGLLFKVYGPELFKMKLPLLQQFRTEELSGFRRMLETSVNCPLTSSMGRLFDAVASLIGLRHETRYEGEAAMELEFLADRSTDLGNYPLHLVPGASAVAPWVMEADEMIREIVRDTHQGVDSAVIAAKFHNSLVDAVVAAARLAGEPKVVLSGGCFQNRRLSIGAIEQLQNAGFHPYWHQRVPPNDGGIALGQLVAAGRAST
jgi:hydrogenase maturation protein HypF